MEGSSTRGTLRTKTKHIEMTDWTSREVDDCLREADNLKNSLTKSLKNRSNCLYLVQVDLAKCLDLPVILSGITGNKVGEACPLSIE